MLISLQLNGWDLLFCLLDRALTFWTILAIVRAIHTFGVDAHIMVLLHVFQLLHDRATLLAVGVEVEVIALASYSNIALSIR